MLNVSAILGASALWVLVGAAPSQTAVPTFDGHVNDAAQVLPPAVRSELDTLLAQYETETTHRITVLIVRDLNGESIEDFSVRVANAWYGDRNNLDNAVLLAISIVDRKFRIDIGNGLSRYVSDEETKAAGDAMVPHFRLGDYDAGLRSALFKLMDACRKYRVD
jgi:uncharacterized protein